MILSHLALAHQYWMSFIKPKDFVIDATCGNGYDSLSLAKMTQGFLLCIDIQKVALKRTEDLLKKRLPYPQFKLISYHLGCHSIFPPLPKPPRLIVYNLGYLPRGDKRVTTQASTTLKSLKKGLCLLPEGGAISLMCYPGHSEGAEEQLTLVNFSKSLNTNCFSVCIHQWINRLHAPSLLLIEKLKSK